MDNEPTVLYNMWYNPVKYFIDFYFYKYSLTFALDANYHTNYHPTTHLRSNRRLKGFI